MLAGARQAKICEVLGVTLRTWQRWKSLEKSSGYIEDMRIYNNNVPANKLSELEKQRILKVSNAPEFANLPPKKIVPMLADEGIYIASESSFYRILKAANQLKHRSKSRAAHKVIKPKALVAHAPNQVYSWDITYLPTAVSGIFLYLYLVMDVYSRKIVGWQIHECESAELAADLMVDICAREGIMRGQVTLHSDNGSSMKGATMLATLQKLGVIPSFSRPAVSNDNPYSESIFKTLKYHHQYPCKPFQSLNQARDWVIGFVRWYNCEHLHSAISFVTPNQRHLGSDIAILKKRDEVYLKAKSLNPKRWSGKTRNWQHIESVSLNPDKNKGNNNLEIAA
jgi:transposase InsO family protein